MPLFERSVRQGIVAAAASVAAALVYWSVVDNPYEPPAKLFPTVECPVKGLTLPPSGEVYSVLSGATVSFKNLRPIIRSGATLGNMVRLTVTPESAHTAPESLGNTVLTFSNMYSHQVRTFGNNEAVHYSTMVGVANNPAMAEVFVCTIDPTKLVEFDGFASVPVTDVTIGR